MAPEARIPKIRAYKDVLNPALHKRFVTGTFRILLPLCYIVSLILEFSERNICNVMGTLPLSKAGLRTAFHFICVLAVFILRVSQWHIGPRTTESPFMTFFKYWFRFATLQTAVFYLGSAWLFCETYIFASSKDGNIHWLAQGKIYDRHRLNERAIYLMNFFLLCATLQTVYHVLADYDRLDISAAREPEVVGEEEQVDKKPTTKLQESALVTLRECFTKAFIMMILSPIIYLFFIRVTAWKYTLAFARIFWSLPKTSSLPGTYPFHITVLLRSLFGGFLLFAIWDFSNLVFSIYVAQPPLKNGKPITDGSNDPNGSLLDGLKARKNMSKVFAFWELQRIARGDLARRSTIYDELDRVGGPTWVQIFTLCSENINVANTRMTTYLEPPVTQSDLETLTNPPRDPPLPRVGTPLKEDSVIQEHGTPPGGLGSNIGNFAKSFGQSSSPYNATKSILDTGVKYAPNLSAEKVISLSTIKTWIRSALKTPAGQFLRKTHRRRALPIVIGTPYGELDLIISAINSLTQLSVHSLDEDRFGKVQKNIREILQLFTTTVENVEAVENKLLSDIHWMDVDFENEDGSDVVPEIDILLKVLRASLQDLIAAFGDYSDAMTLDSRIMRMAREAAGDRRRKRPRRVVEGAGEGPAPGGGGGGGTGGAFNPGARSHVSRVSNRTQERQRPQPRERERQRENNAEVRDLDNEREPEASAQSSREPEMREARPARRRLPPAGAGRTNSSSFPAAGAFEDVFLSERGRGRAVPAGGLFAGRE